MHLCCSWYLCSGLRLSRTPYSGVQAETYAGIGALGTLCPTSPGSAREMIVGDQASSSIDMLCTSESVVCGLEL